MLHCAICIGFEQFLLPVVSKLYFQAFRSYLCGKHAIFSLCRRIFPFVGQKFRRKPLPSFLFVAIMSFGTRFYLSLFTNFSAVYRERGAFSCFEIFPGPPTENAAAGIADMPALPQGETL